MKKYTSNYVVKFNFIIKIIRISCTKKINL